MDRFTITLPALVVWIGVLAGISVGCANAGDWVSSVNPSFPNAGSASAGNAKSEYQTFSIGATSTLAFTNNVALAPPGQEQSDMVLGVTVPIAFRSEGAHIKAAVQYTPTLYAYARNGESNNLQNNLLSLLSVEAVEDFFFVDASANIFQTYISPFAPRPTNGASITDNRTQQTTLGLSPYIRHETGSGWAYLIRNDNYWNTYSASGLDSSATNSIAADVLSPYAPVRYGFDYSYLYTRYEPGPITYFQQIGRIRPIFTVTPRLLVSARLGYETNDYVTPDYAGAVYGAGIHWTPSPRTKVDGFIEHRFFGASYGLNLAHRTPLTVWRLSGTRNNYTGQDQPQTLRPATTNEMLNDAFQSRIPDPIERQQAVNIYMESAGLPPVLTQPYSFYTNQPYLSQQWAGSVALLGATNLIELTIFWQENEPITGSGSLQTGGVASFSQLRQKGVTLTFSHGLSKSTTVTLAATRLYSQGQDPLAPPSAAQTDVVQNGVRLSLTHRLSPKTDGSVGVRWSNFDSTVSPYTELAIFAVISHRM
jgi:uncharacterized protein (PEP-CTERM system associated)